MKVPQRVSQKVLVPPGEVGVAGYRVRPRKPNIEALVSDVVQIEGCGRSMLEVREPLVEKAAEVVGVRRCETLFWLKAPDTRLVLDDGSGLNGHS